MAHRPGKPTGQVEPAAPAGADRCVERLPTVAEYNALRRAAGWRELPAGAAAAALANSLYSVCVCCGDAVIGCGRVVGDGGAYFYVQDVIVCGPHRGRGIARRIMDAIMGYIDEAAPQGAFIGLMTAPGLEAFYGRYGFRPLPGDSPGLGFWR